MLGAGSRAGRQLSLALLTLMSELAAGSKVNLLTVTERLPPDGNCLLTRLKRPQLLYPACAVIQKRLASKGLP